MSYKSSTAIDYLDFVRQVRNFICGYGENNPPVYTGAATYAILRWFGAKNQGVGVTAETWTLTCLTAGGDTDPGAATFSVVGSTTGALADATAGVYYDTPELSFLINISQGQEFAIGETFTVVVTGDSASFTAGEHWTLQQETIVETGSSNGNFLQMEGPGLSDDRTINIIIQTRSTPTEEKWSLEYRIATSYDPNFAGEYITQPGTTNATVYSFARDRPGVDAAPLDMQLWVFVNKQRFIILNATTNSIFHGAYAGFIFPYGSPNQYYFPCTVIANSNSNDYAYNSENSRIRGFTDPAYRAGLIRLPSGTEDYVSHFDSNNDRSWSECGIYPYGWDNSWANWQNVRETEDNVYPLHPCIIDDKNSNPDQQLGELDGVAGLPGRGLQTSIDIIDDGTDQWLVWSHPTAAADFVKFAVRLK